MTLSFYYFKNKYLLFNHWHQVNAEIVAHQATVGGVSWQQFVSNNDATFDAS